jgi:hypothetical protein
MIPPRIRIDDGRMIEPHSSHSFAGWRSAIIPVFEGGGQLLDGPGVQAEAGLNPPGIRIKGCVAQAMNGKKIYHWSVVNGHLSFLTRIIMTIDQ